MSSRAGETTGWFMSLVGQICEISHKNASSDGPGHVFEDLRVGPLVSPRERFLCMSLSLEMKCSADSTG